MSERKEKKLFSSTVALSLLLTVIFIPYYPTSGSQATASEAQFVQFGSATMTTVAGQSVYSTTVTFPTPAPSTQYQVHLTSSSFTPSSNTGASVISFLSDAGQTTDGIWTGMPAASAELFSPSSISIACCRQQASLAGFSSCTTIANVITASNTVNARLSVQWATSVSGPWTDFSNSNVDVHIVAANPRISNTWSSATGQNGPVFLRIVGSNGGGAGDNPQFGNIAIACIVSIAGTTLSYSSITATGFTIFAILTTVAATSGLSIIVQWSIVGCSSGFNPC